MRSLAGLLNPTKLIGLIVFLFSATICVSAWSGNIGAPHSRRLAAVLAILNALLFMDILLNGRWRLHDLLEGEAITRNLYGLRTDPQIAALVFLGVAVLAGIVLALVCVRGRVGAILAVCGAILSLGCWCAEVISLHAVDKIFYYKVKGVMLVSMSWIASSLMMSLGILWDARAARPRDSAPCGKPSVSATNS